MISEDFVNVNLPILVRDIRSENMWKYLKEYKRFETEMQKKAINLLYLKLCSMGVGFCCCCCCFLLSKTYFCQYKRLHRNCVLGLFEIVFYWHCWNFVLLTYFKILFSWHNCSKFCSLGTMTHESHEWVLDQLLCALYKDVTEYIVGRLLKKNSVSLHNVYL